MMEQWRNPITVLRIRQVQPYLCRFRTKKKTPIACRPGPAARIIGPPEEKRNPVPGVTGVLGNIVLGQAGAGLEIGRALNLITRWAQAPVRSLHATMRRLARKLPSKTPPFWKGQLIALACVAGGLAIRLSLTPLVHNAIPVVLFYPFVIIASVWGGALSGLCVLVICALVADTLWLPPDTATFALISFSIACFSVIFMAGLFRVAVEVHAEEEARAVLLTHEMKHRANNLLGVVQAISAQTARNAASVTDHQAVFAARVVALGRAQRLVSENPGLPPDLRLFLINVIEPFGAARFHLDGPDVCVPSHLATPFALLLHELSTNATKYGALSVPEGTVAISWKNPSAASISIGGRWMGRWSLPPPGSASVRACSRRCFPRGWARPLSPTIRAACNAGCISCRFSPRPRRRHR